MHRLVAALLLAAAPTAAQVRPAADSLPLHLFAYDAAAPLELRDSLLRVEDGVEVRRIGFASPRGGRATGLLFVPRSAGSRRLAGVVLQHGAPGSADQVAPRGAGIARHGAVVVALDAPFARRGGPPVRFTPADSAEQVQLIVDLRRAVDLLAARPDVDPARMAYVGASYGGAMGALLAGVERRLATYVLQVADGGLVARFAGPNGRPSGALARRSPEERRRWIAALTPIEPIRFVHRAPPASILFQSGRRDRLIPEADARALHAAPREPKRVTWYDAGHFLNAAAWVDQIDWLHRTIGTSPPTAQDLRGAPRRRE